MSQMSDYLETAFLNHFFRNTATSAPTTVYVALFSAATDESSSPGTELSTGNGYARQAVTFGAPSASSGKMRITNSAAVTFPTATGANGTATHWAISDASTAGNWLTSPKALPASLNYALDTQPQIAIGALQLDAA